MISANGTSPSSLRPARCDPNVHEDHLKVHERSVRALAIMRGKLLTTKNLDKVFQDELISFLHFTHPHNSRILGFTDLREGARLGLGNLPEDTPN
jgi:hypothetical protein